jgi:hypothetical protein
LNNFSLCFRDLIALKFVTLNIDFDEVDLFDGRPTSLASRVSHFAVIVFMGRWAG